MKITIKDKNQIELFLDSLKVEKGLSNNTISAYKKDLFDFALFLNNRKPKRTLDITNADDITDYLKFLHRKSFTSRTQSRRISAIKQFYSFSYLEKMIKENPTLGIKNPKLEKKLPKYLSEEEIINLLSKAKSYDNPMLYTMLEVLYSSGLRVSELVSLKKSSLIENNSFLLIKGKGDKERIIPLTDIASRSILKWLDIRENFIKLNINNQLFLFPSNKSSSYHISRERFAQKLKQLAIECNIAYNRVSPHIIRHSFASHILNNGGDLKSIQDMLGHSDIATTEIYTHILDDKLKDALVYNHPLSSKNKKC